MVFPTGSVTMDMHSELYSHSSHVSDAVREEPGETCNHDALTVCFSGALGNGREIAWTYSFCCNTRTKSCFVYIQFIQYLKVQFINNFLGNLFTIGNFL